MLFKYTSRTIKIQIPKTEIIKLIVCKLVYLTYMIIIPVLFLPFGFGHVFIVFILNHFMVSIIFTSVLGVSHLSDYVEHPIPNKEGKIAMSWPKLQMVTSVDYNAGSTFLNWTLGGFNAHALHHLLPNISHVHYLKLLPIFKEVAAKYKMNYMDMPYKEALNSYYRFLFKMGQAENPNIRVYESKAY